MKILSSHDISRILREPLVKAIRISEVEEWASSLWSIAKGRRATGKPFVMMFPPPNITGNLHLGHALTSAVQDALIRQKKMLGFRSVWVPGFDHAGLATQNIVEKQLWHNKKLTRTQVGREQFVRLAEDWKDLKLAEMRDQINRLGLALDYEREYFTLDHNSSFAVQAAFKQLFKQGVIYRNTKPVFWSEQLQTTLSDIEVERIDGIDIYTKTGEVVGKKPVNQWFVNTQDMAKKAAQVVENSSIDMIPANYKRSWSSWLVENGTQDWCISRQSWWGHRIPAYKSAEAEDCQESWVVADNMDEAKTQLNTSHEIVQDQDVLDTWFSSSLLPLTISGWPDHEKFSQSIEEGFFPLQIMETGFDILTYWVSKMVMMSIALESKIPFELILLHGMICDSQGKKMSKSKGNVIDPLNIMKGASLASLQQSTRDSHARGIIEDKQLKIALDGQKSLFPKGIPECGSDGLRAYLLSHDFQEEVVRIQISQIENVRRLLNKVWNVFRFVIILIEQVEDINIEVDPKLEDLRRLKLTESDQVILSQLAECVRQSHQDFSSTFELHKSFHMIEDFFRVRLSDQYITANRSLLFGKSGTEEDRRAKLQVLVKCIVTSTKLLHPFIPHTTEFLYQKLYHSVGQPGVRPDLDDIADIKVLGLQEYPTLDEWNF